MPKRRGTSLAELEQLLWQPGNRWRNRGHMLSVCILGVIFGDCFSSLRNALLYIMHMSNWIEITPERPHKKISVEEIATTIDKYIPDIVDYEDIYILFGTTRNTFKSKYAQYLKLPKNPTTGDVITAMNKWTDKKWQILHPIKQKDIAALEGMHHKKLKLQIRETPKLQEFLRISNLTYSEIRGFPPYLVEDYFEEIGEPEKYQMLVDRLDS